MNKVVYVNAHVKPTGKMVKVKVPTGETKKSIFGRDKSVTIKQEQWEQTGWSDREIDGQRLTNDIAAVAQTLNNDGYNILSIMPVTSGAYNSDREYQTDASLQAGWGYGYGYGYSYTEGVVIIACKNP